MVFVVEGWAAPLPLINHLTEWVFKPEPPLPQIEACTTGKTHCQGPKQATGLRLIKLEPRPYLSSQLCRTTSLVAE